ncbi:orotidine-5'-phosphate decarboxylase, partial [Streptomyces sp. NPDC003233]
AVFGQAVRNVVPNVSRGVLRHGPDVGALRASAGRFAEEIQAAVAGA